jgi:hypothetical protein
MARKTTEVNFESLYAAALGQLGSPQEIETPQLGRVVFPSAQNVAATLALLRQEAAMAAGLSTAGVFVVGYRSGLEPTEDE